MATRRERVILELQDDFTTGMAKAAAATALLDKNLHSLSGSAVGMNRDLDATRKSVKGVGDEVDKTSTSTREAAKDIDRYSGRLRLITEAAVTLGPALIPIGAVAVPATIALAAGLGAAAGALGVTLLAVNGLGDGLKALNAYQLEPTQANLEKMRIEMDKLGPAGAEFVQFLDSMEPEFRALQETARAGFLPGVEDGIRELMTMLPQVREIVASLSGAMGDLAADAGKALAGDEWRPFFNYLATDAAPTLVAFSHSIGNVAQGLGSLMVAFAPLSRDFASGMESMTESFADWAAGLSETDGFRSFVAYVRQSGPQVLDLLGSIATMFIDIATAAAPVGSAVLPVLTTMARVLSMIAESPIGPPLFTGAVAMLALSRATTVANAAMLKFSASSAAGAANLAKLGAGLNLAAILAGLWAVDAAMDKVFGDRSVDSNNLLTNLTNLDTSAAASELDKIGESIRNINSSIAEGTDKVFGFLPGDTTWSEARDNIEKVDGALASLVQSGNADQAAAAMAEIVKQAHEQGISTEEATKWFKQYNEALANTQAADDATTAQKRYADALNASARVNQITRSQIEGLNAAMEEQRSKALGAFDAVTRYAEALAEAQKRAKQTEAGINAATAEGRKNRDILSQLAAAWNNQGDAVRNNMGKWQAARTEFIRVATEMGVTRQRAIELADSILEIPKQRQIDIKLYGSEEAANKIEALRKAVTSIPREWSTTYYVNQINRINKGPVTGPGSTSADGSTVPKTGLPYADRHPYLLADGEEVISNRYGQADRWRPLLKAINANRLADGGTAGRTLEDQLAIAQIMQQIREYRTSLRKDGKDRLEGLNRRIAELQLRAAEKELRLAEHREIREARQDARDRLQEKRDALRAAAEGISFDGLVPQQPQTVAQGVRSEIDAFKAEILDAGGVWSKELRDWARDMMATAREYDATQAAIEAETKRRSELVDTLNEQQSQLDNLNRTMEAFGAQVAANFLSDPFSRTHVAAPVSPELARAQAQLAELQASGGPGASAQASRLMQQIALLQNPGGGQELSGLDALRATLESDTRDARAFAEALQQLVSRGLDPTSGLYQRLATSGDVTTAQQLAGLSPTEIDQFEAMFKGREDAAAEVAALTTQAAFGEQQAQMQALVEATQAAIRNQDATLAVLNAELVVLGAQVQAGAEQGVAAMQPQFDRIATELHKIPNATARELAQIVRAMGGR